VPAKWQPVLPIQPTGNFSTELKALAAGLLVVSQISFSAFSCASVGTLKPVGQTLLPTEAQLKAEKDIWDTTNNPAASAFNSVLKLPVAGTRLRWTGRLGNMGNVAYNFSTELKALAAGLLVVSQISFSAFSCASVGTLKPVGQTLLPSILARNALLFVLRQAQYSSSILQC
jgi:hypothetical protein